MERIDLGTIIQDSISKFSQNRIGAKPSVFVTLSPALTQVPWKDRTLKEFLRFFLYEALLTSDPDAPVEITLRRRFLLADLKAFVGVQPSYWVQVRISGRGAPHRGKSGGRSFYRKWDTAAKNGSASTAPRRG